MGPKLIAQPRGIQPEKMRDLRNVVLYIRLVVASRNRLPVLGTGRRGLSPASPQARMRGLRRRRGRHAVARQQQIAAVFVQIAPEPRIRNIAPHADRTQAQRRRTVQPDSLAVLRLGTGSRALRPQAPYGAAVIGRGVPASGQELSGGGGGG